MKNSYKFSNIPVRVGVFSHIGKRANNEDSAYYSLQKTMVEGAAVTRFIGVVADGMGGHAKGEVASKIAVTIIGAHLSYFFSLLSEGTEPSKVNSAIMQAFKQANDKITRLSSSDPNYYGMGTTATAVIVESSIDKTNMWVGHVGDSRAYMLIKNGIFQLTKDHSLVQELVDKGEITPEQARTHPQRNIITRALGSDNPYPDILHKVIDEKFYVLICSDGLVHTISDVELHNYIANGVEQMKSYTDILKWLCNTAVRRGEKDNITAMLAGPFNSLT